jgi:hypothetical protein
MRTQNAYSVNGAIMEEGHNLERQLLDKLLSERAELEQHIVFLQKRLGLPLTVSPSASPSASATGPVDLANAGIQRGEFFGLSRPQAASALLKKWGKPLTTTQIFEGLKDASYDVSGKNALNGLYTALSRTADIRKVAPNTWGLREWYPHLKEPKKRIPVMSNEPRALTIEEVEREAE